MNAMPKERMNRGERILVVDDEKSILNMVSQVLGRYGYEITAEDDSTRALQRFQDDPRAFDLIITDLTMPGLDGEMLVDRAKQIRPDIPMILCTGYGEKIVDSSGPEVKGGSNGTLGRDASHGPKAKADKVLIKPARNGEMLNSIRCLLDNESSRISTNI